MNSTLTVTAGRTHCRQTFMEEAVRMRLRSASLVLATVLTLIASPVAAQGAPHLTGVNGTSAVLPALMNSAYGGYTTAIYVENVSHLGLAAHVTIQYFDANGTL